MNWFLFVEDFAHDIELTEEEQIRLLEQYENETKQKKQQMKTSESPEKVIAKTDSAISLDETVSSSSSCSDGDWEKVNVPEK